MTDFDALQIRKVDGGLLLIFHELLRHRRATAAAERLGLSPSAISHALIRLRDIFGDRLFIRRSHGLEPTARALELEPQITAIISALDNVVSPERGFDAARSRRRFRIAAPNEIATLLGASLVARFSREAPQASFSIRPAYLERALRAVSRGEAELALGVFDRIPSNLRACTLYEDEYCVVARKGHPVVRGAIDRATYAAVGHLTVGNPDGFLVGDPPVDREALRATYGELPPPDLVRTHGYVVQWESALLTVAETDVVADCPRRLATRFAGLGAPFRFGVQAVRRAGAPDAGVDWLLAGVGEALPPG